MPEIVIKPGQFIAAAVTSGVLVRDIYLHVFQPRFAGNRRLWQIGQAGIAQEH